MADNIMNFECSSVKWWEKIYNEGHALEMAKKKRLGLSPFSHIFGHNSIRFDACVKTFLNASTKTTKIVNAAKQFRKWYESEGLDDDDALYCEEIAGTPLEIFMKLQDFWVTRDRTHRYRCNGPLAVFWSGIESILGNCRVVAQAGVERLDVSDLEVFVYVPCHDMMGDYEDFHTKKEIAEEIYELFCLYDSCTGKWNGKCTLRHDCPRQYALEREEENLKAHAGIEGDMSQPDVITQEQNTTFSDQRDTIVEQGYITNQVSTTAQNVSMQESQWHVRDVMSKPLVLFTIPWSTADEQGKILKSCIAPGDLIEGPHKNLISSFIFYRSKIQLRIQINSNKFNFGRLIAAFIPQYSLKAYSDVLFTTDNLLSLPHVILDASISNSGVLDIPFVHMNTYFNSVISHPQDYLGQLVLVVFNKLGSTTGASQTVDVSCWVHHENCELHQPSVSHPILFPVTAQAGVEGLVKAAMPLLEVAAPSATKMLGSVMGGFSNCDKPTDPIELPRFVPNTVTNLTYGEGLDKSTRLSLRPGTNTITNAETISTTKDDMDLRQLMKIPTRLTTIKWSTADSSNKLLKTIPVYPCNAAEVTATSGVNVYKVPLLAYISRPCKYYRGGLKWEIEVIGNLMMSGRLQITFTTGYVTSNFQACNYMNTYILDMQEKSNLTIITPYMSERPWLRCDRFMEPRGATNEYIGTSMTGYIVIHVLNRLTVPDSSAQSIDINVLVSGADDFELAFPTDLALIEGIGSPVSAAEEYEEEEAVAQASPETVMPREASGGAIMTKGGGTISADPITSMSENCMDLKTMLRRYYKVFETRSLVNGDGFIAFVNSPTLSGVNKTFTKDVGVQCRTHLCHYSELFTFWRGTLRYKLVFHNSDNTRGIWVDVIHIPGVFSLANFTFRKTSIAYRKVLAAMEATGTILASGFIQNSVEFEVPFYTPYEQLKTIQEGANYNARYATGTIFVRARSASQVTLDTYLYQAAGDDFGLNYLRCPPKLQFALDAEGTRTEDDEATWIYTDKYMPLPPADSSSVENGLEGLNLKDDEEEVKAQAHWGDFVPRNPYTVVLDAVEAMRNTATTVDSTIQSVAERCGVGSGGVDEEGEGEAEDDPDGLWSTLTGFMNMIPNMLGVGVAIGVKVSSMVCAFQTYFTAETVFLKACGLVALLKELLGSWIEKIGSKLIQFASTVIGILNGSKQGNQLPWAQASVVEFIPALVAVVTTALVMIGFKSIPDDKETEKLMSTVSNKLRLFNFSATALSNIKGMFTQMKELTEWVIDQALGLFAPHFLAQLRLERGFEEVEKWAQFIDELDGTDYIARSNYDMDFRNKCLRIVDQAKNFNNLLIAGKIGREASIIREYARKAIEIGTKIADSWKHLEIRIDPYCVVMVGESNVGKSACITDLAYSIMDSLGYPMHNRWCTVNPTEKFFTENYAQQTAVYIDDMSLFNSEAQYEKFCNLKSNSAFPLDMAFKKGEFFNSHFIFATSNTEYPSPNFVTDHVALQRRRNALIEAKFVNEAARNRAYAGDNTVRENYEHARFRIIPSVDPTIAPFNQAPATPWMKFDRLKRVLATKARKHFKGPSGQERKLRRELLKFNLVPPEFVEAALPFYDEATEDDMADLRREQDQRDGVEQPRGPELVLDVRALEEEDEEYVDAVADASVEDEYVLDVEKCLKDDVLNMYSQEMLEALAWNGEKLRYELKEGVDACIKEEYDEFNRYREEIDEGLLIAGVIQTNRSVSKYDVHLVRCSTKLNKKNVIGRVKGCFTAIKEYLAQAWVSAKKRFPLLGILESWPGKLAACCLALAGVAGVIKAVAHRCYCTAVRYSGYRCRFCGRWPEISACLDKEWLLQEWKTMYGATEEYQSGKVTSIEEENDWLRLEGIGEVKKPWLGTKDKLVAHGGPYSDNTKGMGPKVVVPHTGPYTDIARGATAKTVVAHGGQRAEELINNRIVPALYRVRTANGLTFLGMNAVAVGGRKIFLPKHFIDVAKLHGSFDIFHSSEWLHIVYEERRATDFPGKDLVVYDMPVQFHAHRDLTGHFIEEAALSRLKTASCALVRQGTDRITTVMLVNAKAVDEQKYTLDIYGKVETYVTRGMWKYQAPNGAGTCGSVLMTLDNKSNGTILGLHVCGTESLGWATLITKEMVEGVVKEGKLGTPIPNAHGTFSKMIPEGHFGLIGKTEQAVYQSDKTQIIPTAIHGKVMPVTNGPTVLSSKDPRLQVKGNIMSRGIAKYAKAPKPFDIEFRKMICEDRRAEMETWVLQRKPKVLSDEEAVAGLEGLPGFDRMNMATSPGYPWVLSRPRNETGKAYLFDINTSKMNPELERRFGQREKMAKLGERVESVWTCCLKDEKRSLKKIAEGSTRLFVIPPVDYTLLARKYALDYSVALKDNRRISSSQVGIDPQSLDWTELYYRLAEFSEIIITGDFKDFDGTQAPDLIEDFWDDCDYFYRRFGEHTEDDTRVRNVLKDESIHTILIGVSNLFMTHTGNKSGNPMTVNQNGSVNDGYVKQAYLGLARRRGLLATMAQFHKHVRVIVYGDDNIIAIKPEVIEWFNQNTISEYLLEYGIIYTDALKTGNMKPYTTLSEMTFLKQGFRDHESIRGIKVPIMSEETIGGLLNWTRIAPDQDELLESNCNDALRFAYFYGQSYFENLRDKIVKALKEASVTIRVMTYMDFHYWFLFTIGMLPSAKAQGFFETVSQSGNSPLAKLMSKVVEKPLYAMLSTMGLLEAKDSKERNDDRYAIAIPSGEGKTWLCRQYPNVFVDHDDILLPSASRRLKERGLNWEHLWGMFDEEFPREDRRILLVHHPNNTKRQMLGCYKLPKPSYIRANFYQRLRLGDVKCMERDERNMEILTLARKHEPNLFG